MQAELHLFDAFTSSTFSGNTAGVCIPDGPADTAWLQQVAAELKHSETAFLFPEGANWNLRWFTPLKEVELCGHATLAAAFVLWESGRVHATSTLVPAGYHGNDYNTSRSNADDSRDREHTADGNRDPFHYANERVEGFRTPFDLRGAPGLECDDTAGEPS